MIAPHGARYPEQSLRLGRHRLVDVLIDKRVYRTALRAILLLREQGCSIPEMRAGYLLMCIFLLVDL